MKTIRSAAGMTLASAFVFLSCGGGGNSAPVVSRDAGNLPVVTWTRSSAAPPENWTSVASSADGTKLVATVGSFYWSAGYIYTSGDSGATWTQRGVQKDWSSVASSADGTKLVAAVDGGHVYTSGDSGENWTPAGTTQGWSSVASSADGTKLVAVANNQDLYGCVYTGTVYSP